MIESPHRYPVHAAVLLTDRRSMAAVAACWPDLDHEDQAEAMEDTRAFARWLAKRNQSKVLVD